MMHQCPIDHKLTSEVVGKTFFLFKSQSSPTCKDDRVLNFVWESSPSLEGWVDKLSSGNAKELEEYCPTTSFWCSFEDALRENPYSVGLNTYRNDLSKMAVRLVTVEDGFMVPHTVTIMMDGFRNQAN